jgi:2-polyprenyl-6-methoxyphenol hydroxylase-like FAD-dependent oxidoreductase
MRITCVGGGPAGLYFCLLMKLRDPRHDVMLLERNETGATHGWGVTLEQDVLDVLRGNDPVSADALQRASVHWTEQAVHIGGEREVEGGYSINSIGRQALVDILASRARDAGVRIVYGREVADLAELPPSDLVVAADGVRSRLRSAAGGFGTDVREGGNRYIWLGTSAPFDTFSYIFVPTDHGWVWAYAYQFRAQASTVIVECSPLTWAGLGFDAMSADESVALLSDLFKNQLDGHQLIARLPDGTTARWLNFPTVANKRWHAGNLVLAGDSAHTAHYSLGQGTTMALEDAIVLADSLRLHADLETALTAYETRRKAELARTLRAAHCSSEWFEDLQRYIHLKPHQFAAVLHARWSPLIAILPPRLSYQLRRAAKRFAVLDAIRRQVRVAFDLICDRRKSVLRSSDQARQSS